MIKNISKEDEMQTIKKERYVGIALYGSVLILMLASAIAGAVAGQYFNLPIPSVFRETQPKEVGMAPLDSSSDPNLLRQEHLDMRHAEVQSVQVQPSDISSLHEQQMRILTLKERMLDVQIPEEPVVAFPTWQELRKEHLDLLAATHVRLQPNEGTPDLDTGSKTQSTYERYWAVKAEQIK
jgi:hypothetical protein